MAREEKTSKSNLTSQSSFDTQKQALQNQKLALKARQLSVTNHPARLAQLEAAATAGNERAKLAINAFVESVRHYIGAQLVALGGTDALVFTGGIGYRSAEIRRRVCGELEWLGVKPDQAANETSATRFDGPSSRVALACLETDEEAVIATHTRRLANR